ncbi:hypothetical protein GLOIN_2v1562161 [Rhizophagus irregularis DAOM 181602=DAOM 197198]|uniref:Uncharacterized protein n=1 Tax=Rhizophagus irregularis (strain DAOM 181602 / DAOM 197198 / MUCL 43194) TaxID=747089 RepID=A0A2P4QDR0_RHIID|nr:hypothetical protein GLOIN_2v1562161 [Rhizophagus irregularis DAOM 181602=DAOM 197198]POG75757.1 hypothetical protein GLOIN_2v1562161 [Rhizophagus irregularis DAOM 181602=DAOM 197198]|eukprot:XP_025182623.1 hypothetical protein GLOIN_2v1562161 [Rhizophagus irregularis DAOM 181602=DAOM 197198]
MTLNNSSCRIGGGGGILTDLMSVEVISVLKIDSKSPLSVITLAKLFPFLFRSGLMTPERFTLASL